MLEISAEREFLRKIEKSQTLAINEQSSQLEQKGVEVYKFGFGQSPFLPPDFVIRKLQESAHLKSYSPVQGIAELREAVASFHQEIDKIDIKADQVMIAPGSKILIYIMMAAFTKADVLVPAPSWVTYIPQAHIIGHNVIKIPTSFKDRWRLTPKLLEKAVKSKHDQSVPSILILTYPGNPDGLTYTGDELAALAETARAHDIFIISDEIYGLLNHTGNHQSIARYYPERTIVTTGLSKWCGAGGWRLGAALLPNGLEKTFKETLLGIASETYSCASLPVQAAACEAYQLKPEIFDYIRHQRRILAALGSTCYQKLSKAGIKVHQPEGAFYLFLDFSNLKNPEIGNSEALCRKLLAETGVALVDGRACGMEPGHPSARLAYADFNGTAAMNKSMEIGLSKPVNSESFSDIFAKTFEGIDKLRSWARQFTV